MPDSAYALSIKQPWATLLVYGLKTIEIRRWPTPRRGRVLIHAGRISDPCPAAWKLLSDEMRQAAYLVGGLVGDCELTGCITYRSKDAFAADQAKHLNQIDWFQPPLLYGFVVANPRPLPFRPYPGWVRFFPVKDDLPRRKKHKAQPSSSGPTLFAGLDSSE